MRNLLARLLLGAAWLLHWLPLSLQAALGCGFGLVLHRVGARRRRVALRNVALCLPELAPAAQAALVREHFEWLGRSLLERAMLWYASPARLRRLIHVEGDVHLAENGARSVMWLVPHFLAVDVAGAATQLFQTQGRLQHLRGAEQPGARCRDAPRPHALRPGRDVHAPARARCRWCARSSAACPSSICPTWTSACATPPSCPSSAIPAATLLAPSRLARSLNMVVQPVVAEILPRGRG